MCENCGCSAHNSNSEEEETRKVDIEQDVLAQNDAIAHSNWHWLDDRKINSFNVMSSPGSGKTYLLEKTLAHLSKTQSISVIVGDQETENDAKRLMDKGANIKQINTYSSCHLNASMIKSELGTFIKGDEDILFIENIGNLICPAAFNLGEKKKIGVLSTTEGEDKPIKYPVLFNLVDLVVITKIDLIPHLDWELDKAKDYIKQVNPNAKIIALSAKTGEGMDQWYEYIVDKK